MRIVLFGFIIVVGIVIGSAMATYVFFGILTLIGMVAMIESIPFLRWFAGRTSSIIDVFIFTASIIATIQLGVTITASLTVAGLGYTLVYAPYLRGRRKANKQGKKMDWKDIV